MAGDALQDRERVLDGEGAGDEGLTENFLIMVQVKKQHKLPKICCL